MQPLQCIRAECKDTAYLCVPQKPESSRCKCEGFGLLLFRCSDYSTPRVKRSSLILGLKISSFLIVLTIRNIATLVVTRPVKRLTLVCATVRPPSACAASRKQKRPRHLVVLGRSPVLRLMGARQRTTEGAQRQSCASSSEPLRLRL